MTCQNRLAKLLCMSTAATLGLAAMTIPVASETRVFFAGKIYDESPQLCTTAGTGCGKEAADTWCQRAGFEDAMSFRSAPDSSLSHRAQLVASGDLCGSDSCNGFHFVKCYRTSKQ